MEILISFILPFIVLLTVVVFIHEYGHYYFAKKYGVGVTDFSIGFGKELFGFNDKSGTRWKFCAIPLGGYVKFFGDRNVFSQEEQKKLLKSYSEEDQKKLFVVKPIYQRSLIVAAGPFANFLLAVLIFTFIYMFAGKDFTPAQINDVQIDSPAYVAGIKNRRAPMVLSDRHSSQPHCPVTSTGLGISGCGPSHHHDRRRSRDQRITAVGSEQAVIG